MRQTSLLRSVVSIATLVSLTGCAGISQPFQGWKDQGAQITMFRLQNYEPPIAPTTSQGTNLLPPQIQQWMQAGALMLPPGLLPPGLIPGSQPAPQETQVARFHNFRILGWMTLNDNSVKNELYQTLGKESGFASSQGGCMYAEFGVAFQSSPNAPSSDLLVSLSCNQVGPIGFSWPYAGKTALTAETAKKIVGVAQTTFGG